MRTPIAFLLLLLVSACFDFRAADRADVGGRCYDSNHLCIDGLKCVRERCIRPDGSQAGESCSDLVACAAAFTCNDQGICASPTGSACSDTEPCISGLACQFGICVEPCEGILCTSGEVCDREHSPALCVCAPGTRREGDQCVSVCEGVDCAGRGQCEVVSAVAECQCTPPFIGDGATCRDPDCVSTGESHNQCLGGELAAFDNCDNFVAVVDTCGTRGCAGNACVPVLWKGLGNSAFGDWRVTAGGFQASECLVNSGNVKASSSAVALRADGNPCVVWANEASDGAAIPKITNHVFLRCWDGTTWAEIGGSGSGDGLSDARSVPSITIDPVNSIYVAWSYAAVSTFVRGARWNGSTWGDFNGNPSSTEDMDEGEFGLVARTSLPGIVYVSKVVDRHQIPVYRFQGFDRDYAVAGTVEAEDGILARQYAMTVIADLPVIAWVEGLGTPEQSVRVRRQPGVGRAYESINPDVAGVIESVSLSSLGNDVILALVRDGRPEAARFSNGGWTTLPQVSSTSNASLVQLTSSGSAVFMAWIETRDSGNTDVYVKRLAESGWAAYPDGSASGGGVTNTLFPEHSYAIAASSGRVCVSFSETLGDRRVLALRCADD